MTPQERAWADKQFDRYANSLIETLGANYKQHPRYETMLKELVANRARGAYNIIVDIREAHAHFLAAK